MAFQDVLRIAGIVFLVVAIGLGIYAFYLFRKEDIPSVMSDLSGRSRQKGIDRSSSDAISASTARKIPAKRHGLIADGSEPGGGATGFESDAPTEIAGGEMFAPDARTGILNACALDPDTPTDAVETEGDAAADGAADSPTEVFADVSDQPTTVRALGQPWEDVEDIDGSAVAHGAAFTVTKSVLKIDSDVVIALEKEDAWDHSRRAQTR